MPKETLPPKFCARIDFAGKSLEGCATTLGQARQKLLEKVDKADWRFSDLPYVVRIKNELMRQKEIFPLPERHIRGIRGVL